MKIISKFKDYYDSISNIYGIDNKIVFNRNNVIPDFVKLNINDEQILKIPQIQARYLGYDSKITVKFNDMIDSNKIISFYILSVCGKPFYIAKTSDIKKEWILISDENEEILLKYLVGWREQTLSLEPKRYLERMHKAAGSPIILILGEILVSYKDRSQCDHTFSLHEDIPNLSKIEGFAKRYTKEQIYQDISYWIANVLNESPDVQPNGRPPQTDKEKIMSHGLDTKISFRHRKD